MASSGEPFLTTQQTPGMAKEINGFDEKEKVNFTCSLGFCFVFKFKSFDTDRSHSFLSRTDRL